MFNSRDLYYKEPFGAVATGTEVQFRYRAKEATPVPLLRIWKEDQKTLQKQISMDIEKAGEETVFAIKITAPTTGLYFYDFLIGQTVIGHNERNQETPFGEPWQLSVYNKEYETPENMRGIVFYQIFPDRFYCSKKKKSNIPKDRKIHKEWNEEPNSYPDEKGEFLCNDYFGGDLKGIEEKLNYIENLGVEAIYVNPIFEAHSNHRYNTANYLKIDPMLGNTGDYISLCKKAKKKGIGIVLDGVFNHTGSDSIYFNKEGRYGENNGAFRDTTSKYRNWYHWGNYKNGYAAWWDFPSLPKTNEIPEYYNFIKKVLRKWTLLGASGWRLDVVDEISDEFVEVIRETIKKVNKKNLLIGEVWEDASTKIAYGKRRRYFEGKELDGVMNYPWRTAIIKFIKHGNGEELSEKIEQIREHYPKQTVDCLLNIISTHDVPRAITELGGESQGKNNRDWQRDHNQLTRNQYLLGRQRFLLASILQFTLEGCPCLYYGDEAGLTGYSDPFNRKTYPWENPDKGLVDCMGLLGNIRKNEIILKRGLYQGIKFDFDIAAYKRYTVDGEILVCVNRGETDREMPFNLTENAGKILLTIGHRYENVICGHSAIIIKKQYDNTK